MERAALAAALKAPIQGKAIMMRTTMVMQVDRVAPIKTMVQTKVEVVEIAAAVPTMATITAKLQECVKVAVVAIVCSVTTAMEMGIVHM